MGCDYTRAALHGYLDGELDAARSAEFERHLENCRECANTLGAEESLRSSLQRSGLYEQAPVSLQEDSCRFVRCGAFSRRAANSRLAVARRRRFDPPRRWHILVCLATPADEYRFRRIYGC
jgi:mycothiol system anti-sigma-R factor